MSTQPLTLPEASMAKVLEVLAVNALWYLDVFLNHKKTQVEIKATFPSS